MTDHITPAPEPLGTTTAGKRTYSTGTVTGAYDGRELRPYEGRPSAMDAFKLPSLMNGHRHWRDGRKEAA